MRLWNEDSRRPCGSAGADTPNRVRKVAFRRGLLDELPLPQRVTGGLLDGALLRPPIASAGKDGISMTSPSSGAGAMPSIADMLAAMLTGSAPACCGPPGAMMDQADAAGRRAGFRRP